jgi:cytoskeletal protein CcmA (bactofilin family)
MFELNKKRMTENDQREASRDEARSESAPAASRPTTATARPAAKTGASGAAVIGPSIQIDGDVRGEEDLLIKGEVNGTIHLPNNTVTIGSEGTIRADVHAHTVLVEGVVEGNLFGSERVCVRSSARVGGNITSPRVSLDDGARFKGSIEMDDEAPASKSAAKPMPKSNSASKANGDSPVPSTNGAGDPAAAKGEAASP